MCTCTVTLKSVPDKNAPKEIQCKTCKPNQPRYIKDLIPALRKGCKLERQYHCNPENINLKEQCIAQKLPFKIINQTESGCNTNQISTITRKPVGFQLSSNVYMYCVLGNHIYTFPSVPLMYSLFGIHISFSLFMGHNNFAATAPGTLGI